ncbi:hypothetical protein ACQP3F_31590, partial [Escherichia coli]
LLYHDHHGADIKAAYLIIFLTFPFHPVKGSCWTWNDTGKALPMIFSLFGSFCLNSLYTCE